MIETIKNSFVLEGIAIGVSKGKAEGNAEIAYNMKQKGYSVIDIADLTCLSFAEIEQL